MRTERQYDRKQNHWTRKIPLIIMAFAQPSFAHRNHYRELYRYQLSESVSGAQELIAEQEFGDGIVFPNPSRFRVRTSEGQIVYEAPNQGDGYWCDELIVSNIDKNTGRATLHCYKAWSNRPERIFHFSGSSFEDVTQNYGALIISASAFIHPLLKRAASAEPSVALPAL